MGTMVRHPLLVLSTWICLCCFVPAQPQGTDLPSTQANDNRTPAGTLRNGTLTLHLNLVETNWFPEKEPGPSLHVYAFCEEGHVPQIPGPLIRVPQGTRVHAIIHNALPMTVY